MRLHSMVQNYMYAFNIRNEAGHTGEFGQTRFKFDKHDEYREYIETLTNSAMVINIVKR
jgi:hypothetical protein